MPGESSSCLASAPWAPTFCCRWFGSAGNLVEEIGALWVGEETWRRGHRPRIFVDYCPHVIASDMPQAELIFGFRPDDTVALITLRPGIAYRQSIGYRSGVD